MLSIVNDSMLLDGPLARLAAGWRAGRLAAQLCWQGCFEGPVDVAASSEGERSVCWCTDKRLVGSIQEGHGRAGWGGAGMGGFLGWKLPIVLRMGGAVHRVLGAAATHSCVAGSALDT